MKFLRRLFRRKQPRDQGTPSKLDQEKADEDSAREYWKAEVASDQKRRGTPEKDHK